MVFCGCAFCRNDLFLLLLPLVYSLLLCCCCSWCFVLSDDETLRLYALFLNGEESDSASVRKKTYCKCCMRAYTPFRRRVCMGVLRFFLSLQSCVLTTARFFFLWSVGPRLSNVLFAETLFAISAVPRNASCRARDRSSNACAMLASVFCAQWWESLFRLFPSPEMRLRQD